MSEELSSIPVDSLRFYPEEIASPEVRDQITDLWQSDRRFIILSGPPGVGKTRAAEDYVLELLSKHEARVDRESCRLTTVFPDFRTKIYEQLEIESILRERELPFVWDLCVLHPQYSYEDLIRGFRMIPRDNKTPTLEVREGILSFMSRVVATLQSMGNQSAYPSGLLIMDEINRAPIGQLFGEALYALERRNNAVATPYDLSSMGSTMVIPDQLLVLGTMNSVDRAITGFDFALRRRFVTLHLAGNKAPVLKRFENFSERVASAVSNLYDAVQNLILNANKTGIVPKSELVIGHAFFLPPSDIRDDDAAERWIAQSYKFQVLPTLVDYQEQGLLEYKKEDAARVPGEGALTGDISLSAIRFEDILGFLQTTGIDSPGAVVTEPQNE
jgi:5-methylcytosine-specific restriction enzyme B